MPTSKPNAVSLSHLRGSVMMTAKIAAACQSFTQRSRCLIDRSIAAVARSIAVSVNTVRSAPKITSRAHDFHSASVSGNAHQTRASQNTPSKDQNKSLGAVLTMPLLSKVAA